MWVSDWAFSWRSMGSRVPKWKNFTPCADQHFYDIANAIFLIIGLLLKMMFSTRLKKTTLRFLKMHENSRPTWKMSSHMKIMPNLQRIRSRVPQIYRMFRPMALLPWLFRPTQMSPCTQIPCLLYLILNLLTLWRSIIKRYTTISINLFIYK